MHVVFILLLIIVISFVVFAWRPGGRNRFFVTFLLYFFQFRFRFFLFSLSLLKIHQMVTNFKRLPVFLSKTRVVLLLPFRQSILL